MKTYNKLELCLQSSLVTCVHTYHTYGSPQEEFKVDWVAVVLGVVTLKIWLHHCTSKILKHGGHCPKRV